VLLRRIDKDLAAVALKVQEQQDALNTHHRALARFHTHIETLFDQNKTLSNSLQGLRNEVLGGFELQAARISRAEQEIETLRRDYPRWKPDEQAEHLGAAGFRFLFKGNSREAARAFRFAHANDPTDACYLYGLAVAIRRNGQAEEAELYLARAVAAERKRSLVRSLLWNNVVERLQGDDRAWMEATRKDAVYGVYVPGTIRVPDVTR
jgi:hypothetical protein